ncbi:MAG: uncharacterized protein K0R63_744 [Rickettsiales bacterium]|jgi:hypothetical protein|nr:uncharacterized protein [Rickettsiales bacterium]
MGKTSFFKAIANHNEALALEILEAAPLPIKQEIHAHADKFGDPFLALRLAAGKGYIRLTQSLCHSLSDNNKAKALKVALCESVRKEQLESVRILHKHYPAILGMDNHYAFYTAVEKGNVAMVEYIYNALSPSQQLTALQVFDYRPLYLACKGGKLDLVKFLCHALPAKEKLLAWQTGEFLALRTAAENGHDAVVRFFWEAFRFFPKISILVQDNYTIVRNTAANGHYTMIKLLYNALPLKHKRAALQWDNGSALRTAIENGHCEIVELLLHDMPPEDSLLALQWDNSSALQKAVENGYYEIVQLILNAMPPKERLAALQWDGYKVLAIALHAVHSHTARLLFAHTIELDPEGVRMDNNAVFSPFNTMLKDVDNYKLEKIFGTSDHAQIVEDIKASQKEIFTYAENRVFSYPDKHFAKAYVGTKEDAKEAADKRVGMALAIRGMKEYIPREIAIIIGLDAAGCSRIDLWRTRVRPDETLDTESMKTPSQVSKLRHQADEIERKVSQQLSFYLRN